MMSWLIDKAGTLAGRLRRKERIEDLFPDLGRNPCAIITDADFDMFAMRPGRRAYDRFKTTIV